jgi:Rap1a immunity proteins
MRCAVRFVAVALTCWTLAFPLNAERLSVPEAPSIAHSGNDFLQICKYTEEEFVDTHALFDGECLGFVSGLIEGVWVTESYHHVPQNQPMFCMPDGVTSAQLIRIVKKYIEDTPQMAHVETRYLASNALRRAFPCNK